MIEYNCDPQNSIPSSHVKIIGLGGAGANMLRQVSNEVMDGTELLALDADIRTLNSTDVRERIQLGKNLTKGLGAGGDPLLGYQVMEEAENAVRASIKGRKIVFLCVGLGGGTGSGAAPTLTRIAREEGAFVVIFATMPFFFEGDRRREQADTALNELAGLSNALVTFDNNRMGELVVAKKGIHEAFSAADHLISESIRAVIRLVIRPGIIHVGLDDLMTALRTTRSRCLFGTGSAKGKDRANEALANALSSPLLDKGTLLKEASSILVHICGGADLSLFEVELLMKKLIEYVPKKAHILFGAAIDVQMGDKISITLISALPEEILKESPSTMLELEPTIGFESPDSSAEIPEIPAVTMTVPDVVPPVFAPEPVAIFIAPTITAASVPLVTLDAPAITPDFDLSRNIEHESDPTESFTPESQLDVANDVAPSIIPPASPSISDIDRWSAPSLSKPSAIEPPFADAPFAESTEDPNFNPSSFSAAAAKDLRDAIKPASSAPPSREESFSSTNFTDVVEKNRSRSAEQELFAPPTRGKFQQYSEDDLFGPDELDKPAFLRVKKK
jgi:cell division protein FtsZ